MSINSIYNRLCEALISWVHDISHFLQIMSKKLTASVTWEYIGKQIQKKIEKWYILVQDAVDDTDLYLMESNINEITPEIEDQIRKAFDPKLKEYQEAGKEFLKRFEDVLNKVDPDILRELKDIFFEITVDNIINILREMFDEK